MDIYNFMTNCQYEFDDIKTRIKAKLLRRDDNLNIMDVAPFIDAAEDNLLIVFYVDLGYVNNIEMPTLEEAGNGQVKKVYDENYKDKPDIDEVVCYDTHMELNSSEDINSISDSEAKAGFIEDSK